MIQIRCDYPELKFTTLEPLTSHPRILSGHVRHGYAFAGLSHSMAGDRVATFSKGNSHIHISFPREDRTERTWS